MTAWPIHTHAYAEGHPTFTVVDPRGLYLATFVVAADADAFAAIPLLETQEALELALAAFGYDDRPHAEKARERIYAAWVRAREEVAP